MFPIPPRARRRPSGSKLQNDGNGPKQHRRSAFGLGAAREFVEHYHLGMAYEKANNHTMAKNELQQALRVCSITPR